MIGPQNELITDCMSGHQIKGIKMWREYEILCLSLWVVSCCGCAQDQADSGTPPEPKAVNSQKVVPQEIPVATVEDLFDQLAISSSPADFLSKFTVIQSDHGDAAVRLAEQELAQPIKSDVSPEESEVLVRRQANAAILLLKLDKPQSVWPLLKQSPDPGLRSSIINWLGPRGGDVQTVISRYEQESEVSVRRALLLCLGEFELSDSARQPLIDKLLDVYRNDPEAGVHAAAEWLLRRWYAAEQLVVIDEELAQTGGQFLTVDDNARDWFINGQGQTFAALDGGEFQMGSAETEAHHQEDENLHRRVIEGRFAIGVKEVTFAQWRTFSSQAGLTDDESVSGSDDSPVVNVTWFQAVHYCNWLSEREGIPEDQWCYEANADGVYGPGMKSHDNFWERGGYRLPTESEWEYACRAGSVTSYNYGNTNDLLSRYAWHGEISGDYPHPVGLLKPNDFGLFDMHGNVLEWCSDWYGEYPDEVVRDRKGPLQGSDRVLRGGSWISNARYCRSAFRIYYAPVNRYINLGFRVCLSPSGAGGR